MNTGDTAWVLVSTILVFVMTPGLAFFYGGLVRRKNVLSILMQCFTIMCVISLQWVLYGFPPSGSNPSSAREKLSPLPREKGSPG